MEASPTGRLRSRSVRGSTLELLTFTRQTSPSKQSSKSSCGIEGMDLVVRRLDRLESTLQAAFGKMEEKMASCPGEAKLLEVLRTLEETLDSLRRSSASEALAEATERKPPEVSPRFAELPRSPGFGAEDDNSRGSERTSHWSSDSLPDPIDKAASGRSESEGNKSQMGRVLSVSVGKKIYQRHYLKRQIWACLEDRDSSYTAWCYGFSMNCLILLSVLLSLYQASNLHEKDFVGYLDLGFDLVFALDLLVRLLAWPTMSHFCLDAYNIIDLSVVPSLMIRWAVGVESSSQVEAGVWSAILLCFFPVLRLLKLLRRFQTFQVLLSAWSAVFEALPMLIYVLAVITMTFASLLYVCEPRSNIPDWPTALWLTVVSMTGLGYGDLTPQTALGKAFVSILIIASLLYLSIPFGILGSAFTLAWGQRSAVLAVRKLRKHLANHGFTAKDVPKLLKHFDLNHDSEISLVEFRTMMNHVMIGLRDKEVIELFQSLDFEQQGVIAASSFLSMIFPRAYEEEMYQVPIITRKPRLLV